MATKLAAYFPIIREREEVLEEIRSKTKLLEQFNTWSKEQQKEFLDFCTGVKGVKLLYDSFFKEIINPEMTPERMEELISLLLGEKVKILSVLPGDSTRIAVLSMWKCKKSAIKILSLFIQLCYLNKARRNFTTFLKRICITLSNSPILD